MEFDVCETMRTMGHTVVQLGVKDDLSPVRKAIADHAPHIIFNLLESFHDVGAFDQHVASFLELLRVPYTGCNPRGLTLARDKALSKTLLAYHRIPVPDFIVVRRGRRVRRPKKLGFPLIVKSLTQEASIGISRASVVDDDERLQERVRFIHQSIGTDAIVEQFIGGRELYVGILGNQRLEVFPVWELRWDKMPEDGRLIMTDRAKWNTNYQKKYGVMTGPADISAEDGAKLRRLCKRIYRTLDLSGYARIDLRMDEAGRVYVLEANPNPQLAYGEDFAESAEHGGISYEALLQKILNCGLSWRPERLG
jgi:D-alanine-D-alanine ligase